MLEFVSKIPAERQHRAAKTGDRTLRDWVGYGWGQRRSGVGSGRTLVLMHAER